MSWSSPLSQKIGGSSWSSMDWMKPARAADESSIGYSGGCSSSSSNLTPRQSTEAASLVLQLRANGHRCVCTIIASRPSGTSQPGSQRLLVDLGCIAISLRRLLASDGSAREPAASAVLGQLSETSLLTEAACDRRFLVGLPLFCCFGSVLLSAGGGVRVARSGCRRPLTVGCTAAMGKAW